jgi:nucleotide-binding universal stress UspA family protein
MPDSKAILADAVARATTIWADGVVTSEALPGPVAAAFVDASVEADTVVVGAPGHRRQGYRDFTSTAWQVAIQALCPVVVVPEMPDPRGHRTVVVGVDGSPGSNQVVEYAFRSA